MNNFQLFKPLIEEKSIQNVVEVLKSGWIGLGPKTKEFEEAFAKYLEVKYCVGLNSGTAALHLALILLDLQEGDEVITTPITFVSTNHVILYCKAIPVFADVKMDGTLDPVEVEKKITKKTKAIIVVHYAGYPADLDSFWNLSRKYNIPIIEDCAHACGAEYKDKKIGSQGLLQCFSFHAVKNLSLGDGGSITTNNFIYYERLKKLRWLGIDRSTFERESNYNTLSNYLWDYDVEEMGYKYHMNDIQASLGLGQLFYLDEHNKKREELVNVYKEEFNNCSKIKLPFYSLDRKSSYHFYPIFVNNREKIILELKKRGISPGVHYKRNDLYKMYKKSDLVNTEIFSNTELTLPLHLYLSKDDIKYIAEQVKEIVYKF